jgi:spore germination protein YaaH
LQDKYSAFLRQVSASLHRAHKKLSHCVALYDGMDETPPAKIFYDPSVVAKTCDLVRVMCYDLYYAPDRGDPARPAGQGFGPTSTAPWAKTAMQFWLRFVPREKLIMGLPAYSNDYSMALKGRGAQIEAPRPQPAPATPLEKSWLSYERINAYLYQHGDGTIHLFYASDDASTNALLAVADELNIPSVGFWHFSTVDQDTWQAVRDWFKK